MSKTLFIVRHAKSSWEYGDTSDIDRPLSIRGIHDAGTMAGRLKSKGESPSLMISSPACRALHTAVIFARILKLPFEKLFISDKIYPGSVNEIFGIIEKIDESYESVMIFGHNPVFTELANYFFEHPVDNVPTCGMATLKFPKGNWKEIKKLKPVSESLDFPKKS